MATRIPADILEWAKKEYLEGPSSELYLNIGFYLGWFAAAETSVTAALANVLGYRNWDRFELVVRGMDPRVKCERLRHACDIHKKMGTNLDGCLEHFERKCIPLRNIVAHSWPLFIPEERRAKFLGFGRMATPDADMPANRIAHMDDIFSQAMWLNLFAGTLIDSLTDEPDTSILEITSTNPYLLSVIRQKASSQGSTRH